MTKTPRTDEAALGFARVLVDREKWTTTELVDANFARQIERELQKAIKQGQLQGMERAAEICKDINTRYYGPVSEHLPFKWCIEAIQSERDKLR